MKKLIFSLIFTLAAIQAVSAKTALGRIAESPQAKAWADSVYATLTQRERVAQLMIAHIDPTKGATTQQVIKRHVDGNKVGGILFTKGTTADYASSINYARQIAKVPLMMTLDGEWGAAMRLKDAPAFPANMALGAISSEQLLYDYGREMARQCKALGIQVNFAPVLDVNSNPANPVIGYRSFGEDPKRVAALGRAYSTGLEDGGVMATAKHFPGHGDTDADSHKSLPVINHKLSTLNEVDLVPFQRFIDSGASGVMVGHLSVPALDPSGTPASMSRKITTGVLKEKMGFNGLVFTDGLGMEGAKVRGNRCVSALAAGADVLLGPTDINGDINAVLEALRTGKLKWTDVERSCKKMLAYKYALGLANAHDVDEKGISATLNSTEADDVNRSLADAAVTVLSNHNGILPLGDLAHKRIAVVNIGEGKDNEFSQYCSRYADVDTYYTSGEAFSKTTLDKIRNHDAVIVAVYNDNASTQTVMQSLRQMPGLIPVFMVNPYKMGRFSKSLGNAEAIVIVYDNTPWTQRSAAKALFGGIKVDGRLPVNVSGIARMGDGITIEKTRLGYSSPSAKGMSPCLQLRIDSVVDAALNAGAFPGCQVLVVKDGDVIIDGNYGLTTKGGAKVTDRTVYDLASVSKAVGTLPGVMKAYDLGLFQLDNPASEYIPGLDVEGKSDITPRMLLHHETGMPASLSVYNMMIDTLSYSGKLFSSKPDAAHPVKVYDKLYGPRGTRLRKDILSTEKSADYCNTVAKGIYSNEATYDSVMQRIYNIPLRNNRDYNYSCLNFCLLMDLEQRVTGQKHDSWVTDSVWAPLGAGFCYRGAEHYPLDMIAATENDSFLRRQHVHGYVHDELCAFSGGVQGNAGVFGSATDIAKLCQMWLNGGVYGDARILGEETVKLFTTEKSETCRRGLGFDKPDTDNPDNSPTCAEANGSVYGHLGFTGTVFWVDPENNMIFVFLCNRVDPTRNNSAWSAAEIRPALMRLVYEAM